MKYDDMADKVLERRYALSEMPKVDSYVLVEYDEKVHPGKVLEVDEHEEDAKVLFMVAVLLGWLLAAICCLSVLYGNFTTISGRHMPSKHEVALYNSVHSTVWALGVAWVIYACCTGNGGFVNKLLSWSLFIPLSRLTYLVYLVHPVFMQIYTESLRQSIYLTEFDVVYMFLGHLVLAHACAFVLTLAIEAPFIGLEKALLGQGRRH
ncbi:hypothetical protein DPMN_010162 [Dreissena polymorpha]|uniref:Nose resistant to fluoxetine protein 6 n=1 Tax=Dreissena polymorpha TaxID=45954 RepID=A0A9D4N105_DREPO|nr:hypothetical protein DPMN_010162 [Dreissena polymorpha]